MCDERFLGATPDEISKMNLRLGAEIKKRGYRVLWDPKVVKRV